MRNESEFCSSIMKDGEKILELKNLEIEKENAKWKQALILYVVGITPTIGAPERYILLIGIFPRNQRFSITTMANF